MPADTSKEWHRIRHAEIERAFETGEIVKKGAKQDVRICRVQGKKVVIKRYRTSGLLASLRILIGRSRPHTSLRYATHLRARKISCPAHYLADSNWTFSSATTFLLIEYVPGPKLHDFLYSRDPKIMSERTADAVIYIIQALHEMGFAHGDLHTQNIIVESEAVIHLIDLDNIKMSRRRQSKDLARFRDSVRNGRQNTKILLEQLPDC